MNRSGLCSGSRDAAVDSGLGSAIRRGGAGREVHLLRLPSFASRAGLRSDAFCHFIPRAANGPGRNCALTAPSFGGRRRQPATVNGVRLRS